MDRTEEFFHIVETFRKYVTPSTRQAQYQPPPPQEASASSELTQAAGEISNNIAGIEQNLKTLKQLAAKQSLFNDPIDEINRITAVIKQGISQRDGEIKLLESMVVQRTGHSKQQQNSYAEILGNLKQQLARNTKVFTEILQLRNKNLKQQNTRRKNFETDGGGGGLRKRAALNFGQFPAGQQEQEQEMQQQEEVKYHTARAQGMENIEATINELGTMYTRLVHMVAAQNDTVIRIDTNLESAVANVESGHGYLMKYYDRVSGGHKLIIKLFTVLVVVSVIMIVMKS